MKTGLKRTALEQRRVKAARATALIALAFLSLLAVWQTIERFRESSSFDTFSQSVFEKSVHRTHSTDSLNIEQAGITLMDCNEKGSILWYQSTWNVEQSRALLERSLILQGWQNMSPDNEPIMSFLYAPNGLAAGGTLIISFYPLEDGCSILIEVL